jgi:hypothetical protein
VNILISLVLREQNRIESRLTADEVRHFAFENLFGDCFGVSAKTGGNVAELFAAMGSGVAKLPPAEAPAATRFPGWEQRGPVQLPSPGDTLSRDE